uniref:Uncharacterized protein n=1 Tax=Glossina palpalis gambiensis TaxID=67801 RepID=A0A1B0B8H4_9MUSC
MRQKSERQRPRFAERVLSNNTIVVTMALLSQILIINAFLPNPRYPLIQVFYFNAMSNLSKYLILRQIVIAKQMPYPINEH